MSHCQPEPGRCASVAEKDASHVFWMSNAHSASVRPTLPLRRWLTVRRPICERSTATYAVAMWDYGMGPKAITDRSSALTLADTSLAAW